MPKQIIRKGAPATAGYLLPGSVAIYWLARADSYYSCGKKAFSYGSKLYKVGKYITSPMASVNYVCAKAITKTSLTKGMKNFCGVEECNDFYWGGPEYSHLD